MLPLEPKDKEPLDTEMGAISQSTVSVSKIKLKTRQEKPEAKPPFFKSPKQITKPIKVGDP